MGRRLSKNKVKLFSLRRFRDYINARVAFINADKVFVSVGVGFINVLYYINARVAFEHGCLDELAHVRTCAVMITCYIMTMHVPLLSVPRV